MPPQATDAATPQRKWTVKEIRDLTQAKFGKRACWYQVQTALALYEGKHVIGCAPTGAGKTLSFWIPLLMALEDGQDKMSIVVTPLNLLGKQNVDVLQQANLPAIAVSKENVSTDTFKDIEAGKYRVVVINPEILMGNREVEELWKKPAVTKRILNFVFDEGHCISQWSKFRKEYSLLGNLRLLISEKIPFYIASATLPPHILRDVIEILKLQSQDITYIMYSNDRPDIRLMSRPLTFPANSFRDLAFLIPDGFCEGDPPIPRFLVFFDNTKEAEKAITYLRTRLPASLSKKVLWFHSTMTQQYREEQVEAMRQGSVWGLCCTDAFGMGMDIANIETVVQWKATCDLCTLWQRFGRCARGAGLRGTAILLVEKKDTAEERQTKALHAAKRKEKTMKEGVGTKRRASNALRGDGQPKRPALADRNLMIREMIREDSPDLEIDAPDIGAATLPETRPLPALKEERRQLYADRTVVETKAKGREQEQAVDDYINAKYVGFTCCRTVPTLYFNNDQKRTDSHLLCDTTAPDGCTRCAPPPPCGCCDLCNPDEFLAYHVPAAERPPKTSNKSNIKPYKMSTVDFDLKDALKEWRRRTAFHKFNASTVRTLGVRILMSDNILARIVDCAHAGKLTSIEDLSKESGLAKDRINEYGEELVKLILVYHPLPAPPTAVTDNPTRKRAPPRCRACLNVGHNSSSRSCPKRAETRQSTTRNEDGENIPPTTVASHSDSRLQSNQARHRESRPPPVTPFAPLGPAPFIPVPLAYNFSTTTSAHHIPTQLLHYYDYSHTHPSDPS
ncbi:P-loop containing nucleoside triphosphate hydrolase protein [Pholiota molesta]|nr:P-loop containing nucleoside triphosphate hydrolase protein [Pholiota molesta]